ncbi:MAG: copper transporter [Actinobacteria bacterium]|nr:copper transporter [Actinomycetota bacterium]
MINFRFHLVSLIAVFLALALGVVMGATVIDQAIVDSLNTRIDDVRNEANAQRSENSDLRRELDRLRSYVEGTDDFAVAGRLDGVPVAVMALRNVDGDTVNRAVELAQVAGAAAPGVLWLEEKWLLADDESIQQLADVLGAPGDDRTTLRDSALAALGDRLAAGSAPLGTDLLVTLVESGFVTFEAVGDEASDEFSLTSWPGTDARVLLVDGTDSNVEMNGVVEPATRAFVASEVPLVVGEVFREQEDGPDRGSRLAAVRDDDDLRAVVSTVDDLDLAEGRVTAVLALADLGRGVVGQYGYGAGADQSLPEASPR